MIARCEDLGIITAEHGRRLWIGMNRKGWRKEEPFDDQISPERPRLIRRSFQMLVDEGIKTREQIIYELRLTASDLEEMAQLQLGFFNGLDFAVDPKVREIGSARAGNGEVIRFRRNSGDDGA
jgi:hypothetical protein